MSQTGGHTKQIWGSVYGLLEDPHCVPLPLHTLFDPPLSSYPNRHLYKQEGYIGRKKHLYSTSSILPSYGNTFSSMNNNHQSSLTFTGYTVN